MNGKICGNYRRDVPQNGGYDMEDRPAFCDEVEITPEMIEAGNAAMWPGSDRPPLALSEIVSRVYAAMELARLPAWARR